MQAYRAMQGLPPEAKAGIAVLLKLLPLTAAVVGVEHEATLVIAFHQNHTVGRAALRGGCGNAHGVCLCYLL